MKLTVGTIFPQDKIWYLVLKVDKKTVILRELKNYKVDDTTITMGDKFSATLTE